MQRYAHHARPSGNRAGWPRLVRSSRALLAFARRSGLAWSQAASPDLPGALPACQRRTLPVVSAHPLPAGRSSGAPRQSPAAVGAPRAPGAFGSRGRRGARLSAGARPPGAADIAAQLAWETGGLHLPPLLRGSASSPRQRHRRGKLCRRSLPGHALQLLRNRSASAGEGKNSGALESTALRIDLGTEIKCSLKVTRQ